MVDTGYKVGAYAHADHSAGTDWDAASQVDAAAITSDAIDNSATTAQVGTMVSVSNADPAAAISGVVTVAILGSDLDPDSEGYQSATDPVWAFTYTPINGAEVICTPFLVDGSVYPKFKVYVINNSGQTILTTVNVAPVTIPVAS